MTALASVGHAPTNPGSGLLVLVVEDYEADALVLRRAFETGGFDAVEIVGSGSVLMARVADDPPNLIVLDLGLPDIPGVSLLHHLKSDPATHQVPVIVVTGSDEEAARLDALEAGADGFFLKPFDARELLARARSLGKLVRERQAESVEQRALRSELELHRQWARFVAHDLRNGLSTILASTDFVLERLTGRPNTEELTDALAEAGAEGRRLGELTRDLVDTTRLKSGELSLRVEPVDAHDLVEEVIASLAPLARSEGRTIEVHGTAVVSADPDLLRRILHNLLHNALKHARRGAVVIAMRTVDGRVRIEVTNRGERPSGDLRARMFTPVTALISGSQGGHGLGLAFCKFAVAAHGGVLAVDDHPEGGTTFWFELAGVEASG